MLLLDSRSIAPDLGPENWASHQWGPEFWMSLFDELDTPVLLYRPDGRLVWSNREAGRLLGLGGLEGEFLPERLSPLVRGGSRLEAYSHGREISVPSEDGTESRKFLLKHLPTETPGLILASGSAREVREDDSSLRLQSFGDQIAMAGEVSRTVRGPLAGIELNASILGEELDGAGDGALAAILDEIRFSVREVNEYLTSLESMTRPLMLDLRSWNVADLVDEALEDLNDLFKARGVGVMVEQFDMTVECDRALMVQTFLNLFLNAAEAMPRGGRLIVREEMNRAGECEVIITDSGPGVGIRDTVRIFNPFFTTKAQSLGLGLPVSRRIVEAHQGRVVFGNDEALGARVKVVLPCFPGGTGRANLN
jgi:signal transduction histidine kinase